MITTKVIHRTCQVLDREQGKNRESGSPHEPSMSELVLFWLQECAKESEEYLKIG